MMATEVETNTHAQACPSCGSQTEALGRGQFCKDCNYVWVDNVPLRSEDARTFFVAGNLLAKCLISFGTGGRVNEGTALRGVAPKDQPYFQDALQRLTRLGLIYWHKDTYGVNSEKVADAKAFIQKWAKEDHVERLGHGTGNVRTLSEGPVAEAPQEPEAPTPPRKEDAHMVSRSEMEAALRQLRQDLVRGGPATSGTDPDLRLELAGIRNRLDGIESWIETIKRKRLVGEERLERFHTKEEWAVMDAKLDRVTANLDAFTKKANFIQRILDPLPHPGGACLFSGCTAKAEKKIHLLGFDEATQSWTKQSTREFSTCTQHDAAHYVVPVAHEAHLASLARELKGRENVLLFERRPSRALYDQLERQGIRRKVDYYGDATDGALGAFTG